MLNSKQRAYLKSVAVNIDPAFQVGKGGVSQEQAEGIGKYLKAHEIVKVKVLENSLSDPRGIADQLAESTGSEIVIVIGSKFVLYKRNAEKPTSVSLGLDRV